LRDIVKNQGFYDLFLIDIKNMYIVYSVYKETDFATNLESGPYSQSSLAKIVQKIQANPDKGVVLISDFKNYKPSYNFPQAFFATPIYENSTLVGVLAVQLNIEDINNITTGNKSWKNEGLGDSGEVYLVGRDYKMRSDSRMIIQNTTKYFEELNSTNLNPDSKKKIMTLKSTILNQEVHNEAVKLAIEGKDGTIITKNYLNKKVLSAYEPLKLDGLDLAIIAEKEIYEAEKPIRKFQNSLLISSTILATLITFYAIWLAYTFLNPINRMAKGVKDVISGKSKSRINLKRDDEFGELSNSIDNLIETINEQDNTIIEKSKSYDKLLLNILPQSIATRMKNGEKDIAENVPNVAVLFSRLHGLDHLSYHLDAKESIRLLNELINEFDNQAQEFGIEKITTIGDSYMAASGLVAPRLDYARRLVEYAMKMFKIVNQFNLKHNTKLEFSVGIDCGEVMAGIVGDHKFVYDIWGEVVNGANRISHEALTGTLRVSETVYRQLTNKEEFHKCEGGRELTYAIVPKVTHE
jgi:class 3 adenylate cyclase